MKTLLDNEIIKVSVLPRDSDTAVICFTGVGHALGGIDVQDNEFFKISNEATTIFVIDKERSWGNNIDFLEMRKILLPYIGGKTLHALGNSMGVFLAILASQFFTFTSVVSFVPQYSVSKRIIPTENRWDNHVKNIKNWKYESLEGSFDSNTKYYILAGLNNQEKRQLDLFPIQDNVHKIIFEDKKLGHNVAAPLKEMGVLYEVISCCFMLKPPSEIIQIITDCSTG